jgi:hypothetical protein
MMIYASQVDTDIRLMGVARKRIEDVLARQLGADALIYYSHVAQFRHGRYILAAYGLLVVALLTTTGASVGGCEVALRRGGLVLPAFAIVLVLLWATFGRALYEWYMTTCEATTALKTWGPPS